MFKPVLEYIALFCTLVCFTFFCSFCYTNVFADNLEDKNQNIPQSYKSYKSDIESISSKDGLSSVIYSRDNSTGFCWINAQSESAYMYNTISPSMRLMGTNMPDQNCSYFSAAKRKAGG